MSVLFCFVERMCNISSLKYRYQLSRTLCKKYFKSYAKVTYFNKKIEPVGL